MPLSSMASMDHKPCFVIKMKDLTLVKPSLPTPSGFLSLSTIDSDLDQDLPSYSVHVYRANLHSANHGDNNSKLSDAEVLDPANMIKEALSKALVYYYPLAGKLQRHDYGRLRVNCNAGGVPFAVASASCKLSDLNYFDGTAIESARQLVCDFPDEDEAKSRHPFVLQVTKFQCGGFTVGMGTWHAICDGMGALQIYHTIAEMASGKSDPSVKPVWERERLQGWVVKDLQFPMDPAAAAVSPHLPSEDLKFECFHVDEKSLMKLKMSLTKESNNLLPMEKSLTTVEALGAYLWRSRCKAFELNTDGKSLLFLTVGIRNQMNPPLPKGYYGNAYLGAYIVMDVKALFEGPLIDVVNLIKEHKRLSLKDEYIRQSLNYMETIRQRGIELQTPGAFMELTEWKQFGVMQEVDFGWNASVNMIPTARSWLENLDSCIIMPPSNLDPSMKAGARVFITLPKVCMTKFRQEMEALKHLAI